MEEKAKEERAKLPVTVQLMLIKEGKVLLMRRYNTGYEDGKYCFPGGHLEKNEEICEAIIRETKEEIGIDILKEKLQVYKVLNRKINNEIQYIDFIIKATEWQGEIQIMEKDKCDDLQWFNIENIPENTLSYINNVMDDKKDFYIPYNWGKKD